MRYFYPKYNQYKVQGMAVCEIRETAHSFETEIARLLIECDAEGFDDWQCDGGFYHNEGEFNIDWSTARAVVPNEYEILMGKGSYEGRHEVKEIVKVFEQSVLTDDLDIIESEE